MVLSSLDPHLMSYEFFYQIGLSEFGNFGSIEFTEGLNLRDLLAMSMETDESDGMTQQAQSEEIEVKYFPYSH
jgi:hypothetical protein